MMSGGDFFSVDGDEPGSMGVMDLRLQAVQMGSEEVQKRRVKRGGLVSLLFHPLMVGAGAIRSFGSINRNEKWWGHYVSTVMSYLSNSVIRHSGLSPGGK
jgi:hypothetical protein